MGKKVQSSLKNMFLSLTLICVCAAAALACVNEMTSKAIDDAKENQKNEAVQAVFAGAVEYQSVETCDIDNVACFRAVDADGAMVGVAVEASSENGFGGHLSMMVGFDAKGGITGYQVLETQETPGLGAKAATWFQKDNPGSVIGLNPGDGNFKVKADGGQVDAISGSTITSRAFCEIVNNAYKVYQQVVNQ